MHYQTRVAETVSKQGILTGVVITGGETIPCQLLGVAIGVLPQVELAQQAGLATGHGILVDEYLKTSEDDIFAAGDAAQVRDPDSRETWYETLWPTARRQGYIAGANMTGAQIICKREAVFNAIRIAEIYTAIIGDVERQREPGILAVSSDDKESWQVCRQKEDVVHKDQSNRVRVLVGAQTIVGAVVMGDQTLAQPLYQMIKDGTDISSIRPFLGDHPELGIETIARFYQKEVANPCLR